MQRILSFQVTRGNDESSEYVTKRLCFSSLFSVGFLCLFCGFMLGRFVIERKIEIQAQKRRAELEGNGLQNTEQFQQLALQELERASFNHVINWQMPDSLESNMQRLNELFSNLSLIDEITNYTSCVHAIVYGSQEPDRYVILSVNGDGITIALELMLILDRIYYSWHPRRSLVFCVSLVSSDVCPQTLSPFMRRNVVAYVAMHGFFLQVDGDIVLSGSDIMRSIAVEAIKTIPGGNDWTYLEYENFGPRLLLNMPQLTFSYNKSNFASRTHHNQSLRLRSVTLAQMVSQTVWRLSESIVIQWEPKYFNETVNRMLESIDSNKLQDAKEKLQKTLTTLLEFYIIVKKLNIDATENNEPLRVRIWNDLLLDLDKTLLCSDENAHSRTDLATFRKLSLQSTSNLLNYLDEMTKCYENAIQVLQERLKQGKVLRKNI